MIRTLLACAAVLGCFAGCMKGEPSLAPGLVFDLRFEGDCAPTAIADLPRETPASGISFSPGVDGQAAHFDGAGAELKFKGIDALGLRDALTLEMFVRPADWINPYGPGGGLESLVSHSDIFTVAIDPHAWKLTARLTTGASDQSIRLQGGDVQPGVWQHIALVFDGAAGKSRIFLNGEIVSEVATQGTIAIKPNLDLVIGTWFKKNQAFCGELDAIRLWDRALSESEIRGRLALLNPPPHS